MPLCLKPISNYAHYAHVGQVVAIIRFVAIIRLKLFVADWSEVKRHDSISMRIKKIKGGQNLLYSNVD